MTSTQLLNLESQTRKRIGAFRPASVVLAIALALYVIMIGVLGRAPVEDEILFKSAGKQWAIHGLFAAPDITGRLDFNPPITQVYGAYPPLYGFGFGLWSRVFGFGWKQACLYDALIHVTLCWVTYRLMLRISSRRFSWLGALLALAVVFAGTPGRPDELAACLGMGAILFIIGPLGRGSMLLAMIFWGFCLGASPAAFVVTGLVGGAYILFEQRPGWLSGLRMFGLTAAVVALVQMIVWAPVLWINVRAPAQLWEHAVDANRTASMFRDFAWHWRYGHANIAPTFMGLLAALILLPAMVRSGLFRCWCARFVGIFAATLIVSSSHNNFYLWLVFPTLLVFLAASVLGLPARTRMVVSLPVTLLLMGGLAVAEYRPVIDLIWLGNMPSDQTMMANEKILHELVPPNSTVLVREHWFALAPVCNTLDMGFSGLKEVRQSDYLVFTGNYSGAVGARQEMSTECEAEILRDFEVIYSNLSNYRPRLFGHYLTRSARGFGVEVLRRKKPSGPAL